MSSPSRASRTSLVSASLALIALAAHPRVGAAQDLAELVAAGRFEEAAASLAGAGPEEAEAGATMIFNQAYTSGFQARRYEYMIRGMLAAEQVPNLSPRMREQLSFWHGLTLFQMTTPVAQPQDLAAARASLPGFQQAQILLNRSGDYPASIAVDTAETMRALATFIAIQEAIIRRGY